jgi:hypothetical protein
MYVDYMYCIHVGLRDEDTLYEKELHPTIRKVHVLVNIARVHPPQGVCACACSMEAQRGPDRSEEVEQNP